MITPSLDKILKKVRSVAIKVNVRKWRYLKPLVQCPEVFLTKEQLGGILEGMFALTDLTDALQAKAMEAADNALKNEIAVLGSGIKAFREMPWDTDIKTGFRWPAGKYYHDYQIIDYRNNSDVKVPWEISRCHDLVALGLAFRKTKDEKYAQKVVERIEDWMENNPWMRSINWTCAMDVAIRAVNWMWALYLVSESSSVTDKFCQKLSKSLYQHGFYIYHNIENGERYNGNHLVSNLVGLVFIGTLLKGVKRADEWREYAIDSLYNEIRTQFLPSGFHYERSLAYHGLVMEMVGHTVNLLKDTGSVIPIDIECRLNKMQAAIETVRKPEGGLPNIADNDDGHFLPFIPVPVKQKAVLRECQVFEDAGFAVCKKSNYFLFITNGGLSKYPVKGQFNTTHTHCDLLSFDLTIGDTDFIIDAGTCNYTGNIAKRDEYRSTRKHNTVQIDDIEQFKYESIRPFQMYDDVNLEPLKQKDIVVSGSYEVKRQGCCLQHQRSFICRDTTVEIKDEIECQGKHEVSLFFHLDPYVQFAEQQGGYMLRAKGKTVEIKTDGKLKGSFMADTVSKSYGTEVNAQTIILRGQFEGHVHLTTIFEIHN